MGLRHSEVKCPDSKGPASLGRVASDLYVIFSLSRKKKVPGSLAITEEKISGERISGGRISGERISKERIPRERISGERISKERISGERISKKRI